MNFLFMDGRPIRDFASQDNWNPIFLDLNWHNTITSDNKPKKHLSCFLDDIFDKLDKGRVARLLHLLNNDDFGQLLLLIRIRAEQLHF